MVYANHQSTRELQQLLDFAGFAPTLVKKKASPNIDVRPSSSHVKPWHEVPTNFAMSSYEWVGHLWASHLE